MQFCFIYLFVLMVDKVFLSLLVAELLHKGAEIFSRRCVVYESIICCGKYNSVFVSAYHACE